MRYYYDFEETLCKRVCVEADSEEEARDKISDHYVECKLYVTHNDFRSRDVRRVRREDGRTPDYWID